MPALAAAQATDQTQPSGAPKSEPQASSTVDLNSLREQMRQIARDENTASLTGAERGAIEVATAAMKHNDTTMSVVSWVTGIAVAIITIITAGGVGTLLYGQYGLLSEAKKKIETMNQEAAASNARIQQVEKEARETAESISAFVSRALEDTDKYSESLPTIESPVVLGGPPEIPRANEVMQMEEADILTVIGEKFRPQKPKPLARAFLSLGRYWRQIGNYARAIARFQKATLLDSTCWEAFEGLARSYIELSVRPGIAPDAKERLLKLAEEACTAAIGAGGKQAKILCDQAAIADGRGLYKESVDIYKEAQTLDIKVEVLMAWFNPACIYAAEFKDYRNAIDGLAKIIKLDRVRELVARDHDFDGLRADPLYKGEFETLMKG